MGRKVDENEFRKRVKIKFGDYFELSEIIFKKFYGKGNEITIICPKHGRFKKTPFDFLQSKFGCTKCSGKATKTDKEFALEATEVHKGIYGYDNASYDGAKNKVWITCKIHGDFEQRPNDHLSGAGCPECSPLFLKTTPFYIKEVRLVHGEDYDYSFTDYSGAHNNIIIVCRKCGNKFEQSASNHLDGTGCTICAPFGFNRTEPAILYYIQDLITGWYKIGITNRTVSVRFKGKKKRLKIINIEEFNLGKDAFDKEQSILEEFSEYRITNKDFGDGKTEFFSKDILGLDIN